MESALTHSRTHTRKKELPHTQTHMQSERPISATKQWTNTHTQAEGGKVREREREQWVGKLLAQVESALPNEFQQQQQQQGETGKKETTTRA